MCSFPVCVLLSGVCAPFRCVCSFPLFLSRPLPLLHFLPVLSPIGSLMLCEFVIPVREVPQGVEKACRNAHGAELAAHQDLQRSPPYPNCRTDLADHVWLSC